MPTYDYVCGACGHEFEHFQSMTDRLLRTCPKCAKKRLVRKVGGGAGLIFKGSGFYETDYKRAGTGSSGKPPSKATDAPPSPPPASGCGSETCKGTPGTCASGGGEGSGGKSGGGKKR